MTIQVNVILLEAKRRTLIHDQLFDSFVVVNDGGREDYKHLEINEFHRFMFNDDPAFLLLHVYHDCLQFNCFRHKYKEFEHTDQRPSRFFFFFFKIKCIFL